MVVDMHEHQHREEPRKHLHRVAAEQMPTLAPLLLGVRRAGAVDHAEAQHHEREHSEQRPQVDVVPLEMSDG